MRTELSWITTLCSDIEETPTTHPSNFIAVHLQIISILASPHLCSSPKHLTMSCTNPRCFLPESHNKPHTHPQPVAPLQSVGCSRDPLGWIMLMEVTMDHRCPTTLVTASVRVPLTLAWWCFSACHLPLCSLCDQGDEPFITPPSSMRCCRNIRPEGTMSTAFESQTCE